MKKMFLVLGLLLLSPQVKAAPNTFQADSQIQVKSKIAVNDIVAIAISDTPGAVYSVDGFANNTTLAYVKLYNAKAANVTCGTSIPMARYMIPFGQSSSGGGFTLPNINGDAYGIGIAMCITTGIADTDTGAPAASAYIVNVHFKSQAR